MPPRTDASRAAPPRAWARRSRWRVAVIAATLGVFAASGCAWHPGSSTGPEKIEGTCEGACSHYVDCRGSGDAEIYSACVRECQVIFVEDGEADAVSLGLFEQLECEDAIGFIEGEGGRPPGSSPPDLAPRKPAR